MADPAGLTLTAGQAAAAEAFAQWLQAPYDGTPFVLSGYAGTGKTTTLLARGRELLQRGVRPEQIIMVTFTRRATREIRERLVQDAINHLMQDRTSIVIAHRLSTVQRADRIVVMHAGHVVETAPTQALFTKPGHPYTGRLIASTPGPEQKIGTLASIPGNLPDLRRSDLPACRFHARCDRALADCTTRVLPTVEMGPPGHTVRCFNLQ